ncbi:hypothetical protein BBJ28_00006116 [Nothophytophthora sp. Chile5]|nr:hypothetical protein BBJ28_00006116 [Nothophytophthora sp. Chile5]
MRVHCLCTRLRFKNAQSKKAQRPSHQVKKTPSLKNRIRGLERFLKRGPRFFERVKVVRKLRQAKNRVENADEEAERAKAEKAFQTYRQEMVYIYYYPKSEPYISLFPPTPHSEQNLQRQQELRAEALARFETEQPTDAFHQFCFNDGKTGDVAAASETSRPAVELLLKKPSKEMVKKQKKARSKREKAGEKPRKAPALVDQEDDSMSDAATAEGDATHEEEEAEAEEDDFFL